jgi:hypothetical protein
VKNYLIRRNVAKLKQKFEQVRIDNLCNTKKLSLADQTNLSNYERIKKSKEEGQKLFSMRLQRQRNMNKRQLKKHRKKRAHIVACSYGVFGATSPRTTINI